VERADFERFGSHAKEWGKAVGPGLCISGATRDFRFFRRMRKKNLSMAERNGLRKRADSIFEAYGR
jgi:hypothetical protein